MPNPTNLAWPLRSLLLLLFIMSSGHAMAQSCADPGLQSVLRVFEVYNDVTATCEVAPIPTGDVEFVNISYDDFPGIQSFVSAQPAFLSWRVYLSSEMVNIAGLMRAIGQTPSSFWEIDVDDDGDVRFERLMEPLGDVHLESEFLTGTGEVIDLIANHPQSEGMETPEVPVGGVVSDLDWYDKSVQGCIRGVLSEWGEDMRDDIDARGYCECIADKIAADPDRIADMFHATSEGMSELIEGCMEVLMPGHSGFSMEDMKGDQIQEAHKRGYMRGCIREAEVLLQDLGDTRDGIAEDYCSCMYENLRTQSSFSMSDFEDENSVVMTEIDVACNHILTGERSVASPVYWNQIEGCPGVRSTPFLMNSVGEVRVKVAFGEAEKYFTLDSGCSEVILNEDLAKALKISGVIGPGDYLGVEMFVLADGSEVAVEKYRVSEMKVGSCEVQDFVVGVIEEGGMLLGMGYLGLFESWELDQSTRTLQTRN